MSPMVSTLVKLADIVPASDRPLDILRAAFRAAVAMGLRIRAQEAAGVELAMATWRATHTRREVNLAGAVVLVRQPAPKSREDQADVAAAGVLGVKWTWVLGALDGYAHDPNPELLTGADREAYLDGMWAGAQLRVEAMVECPACEEMRLPENDDCKCTSARRR